MADGEMTRPVQSGKTPEDEELDGFKIVSFQQGEQVDLFAKTQRKRVAKRSFGNFGLTTLSLTKDTATRLKKRNRKHDKRFVVDRVDGFTFVSAFTLNDFDEYDKNPVKHPLAPTKRKSTSKIESATSKKKPRKAVDATPENLGTSGGQDAGQGNLIPSNEEIPNKTISSITKKKNVSPLTKSALVRLKKINVSNLKSPKNKKVNDMQGSKAKKLLNLKVPKRKISIKPGEAVSSSSQSDRKWSMSLKVPHMEIDKPTFGGADSFDVQGETTPISLSDEDSVELDICGIDENSSSQFIINNINHPEESCSQNEENAKPKRKPCRVCCAYPCRIVGAKRIKSGDNQFPCFDVSFTSRCQVHTPGEILVQDSSKDKVNVCIQTTSTDIKMHLDFARRFPYRAISIVSCQPSLYDDDLKLPDDLVSGTNQRCSENHRILEQKRREELHGLYCKLADTLSISKNRASKQWILENACKEVQCLEAKDTLLTAKLNLEKAENEKKRKRWEGLAGKPYVAPKESTTKVARKSKLLELYEKYRQEREELENMPGDLKSEQKELKSTPKEQKGKSEGREKVINELQKRINNSKSVYKEMKKARRLDAICDISKKHIDTTYTPSYNNPQFGTFIISANDTVKSNNLALKPSWTVSSLKENPQNTAPCTSSESKNSMPVNASQVENHPKDTLVTTAKHASLGPRQIVHPFQCTSISPKSPSAPVIPKIDLTNESEISTAKSNQLLETSTPKPNQPASSTPRPNKPETSALKSNQLRKLSHLLARKPTSVTTTRNLTTQVTTPAFKSPPPTQSSALLSTTPLTSPTVPGVINPNAMFPTPIQPKPSNPSPAVPSNTDFVIVTMVVQGKTTIFRIPKTAEGLTLLSKLSLMKKLGPDSLAKIAAQFPLNQQSGQATTTGTKSQVSRTSLASSTGLVTTTVPDKTPATPTQWSSAVSTIPNATSFVNSTSKPVTKPTDTQAVNINVNTSLAVKQPITSVVANTSVSTLTTSQPVTKPTTSEAVRNNSSSHAIISRPIKTPTVTPAVKASSGNVGTASHLRIKRLINSDVAISERVKQFNAIRPCKAVGMDKTSSSDVTKQQKLIFLDKTSKKKPQAKTFPVVPTSSSINVTLNKLGSITANKVFNKSPGPTRSQSDPPTVSSTERLALSTLQSDQYQLYRKAPIPIIPKRVPSTNARTSTPCTRVHIYPVSTQIPPEMPPEDLPEIPPDIPSDLTEASLSPLEAIPQISDSLLEGTCQNYGNVLDETGICVISNVFSLTETAACGTTTEVTASYGVEKTSEVDETSNASMNEDGQNTTANADLQNTTATPVSADVQYPNVSYGSSVATAHH